MNKNTLSDYTEAEFVEFVRWFLKGGTTEAEDADHMDEFIRLTEHPQGTNLIFRPSPGREDSPEGVVQEVKQWREASGKPGFKPA